MKDLRDFITLLRERGQLAVVDAPVDPILEMTEIADRVVKSEGPALLFTRPKGYTIPVLMNQFGSHERVWLALRTSSYEELAGRIESLTALGAPGTTWDRLKTLGRLKELAALRPRLVKQGACQEVVLTGDEVDLERLPILQCWPLDAGRYITLPLVFTRDPCTGRRNVGMYRMQVFDKQTTGMHWHIHKDAAQHYQAARQAAQGSLEAAVAIGVDPALTYAATAPLPAGIDEMLFAGFLRREAVKLVQCRTVDLQVPDHAEFVLEGYIDIQERRLEGPFGDHTGYYSLADHYPVFHVTALTHRCDPIYATTVVGRAPMEDAFLGKATERIFLPLLRLTLPELVDLDLPLEGGFHNCVLVAIDKRYPLHARKVMHALWGTGQMQFSKCVVVMDGDVNVHNYGEVAWRLFNNVDWRRDVVVAEGPLDVLDHSSPQPLWGGKIGIDATRKGPEEGHPREWPPDVVMTPAVKARVDQLWSELGLDPWPYSRSGPALPCPGDLAWPSMPSPGEDLAGREDRV